MSSLITWGQDLDEETSPKAACKTLHVSYLDPLTQQRIAEDVFVDPRDKWLGEPNVLLVNGSNVTKLRDKSDKELRQGRAAQAIMEHLRRDYFREQQCLLDEIRQYAELPGKSNAAQAAAQVLETAKKFAERAEQGPKDVVSDEIAKGIGSLITEDVWFDKELIAFWKSMGLEFPDELSVRLALKRSRDAVEKEFTRRAEMQKKMNDFLEEEKRNGGKQTSNLTRMVGSMLRSASDVGTSYTEVAHAIMNTIKKNPMARQETEDKMTGNVRAQCTAVKTKIQELEPTVAAYREKKSEAAAQALRLTTLQEEIDAAEEELLRRSEAVEAEAIRREEEAEAAKQKEAEALEAMRREVEAMLAQGVPKDIKDKMSPEERAQLKNAEDAASHNRAEAKRLEAKAAKLQESAEEALHAMAVLNFRLDSSRRQKVELTEKDAQLAKDLQEASDRLQGIRTEAEAAEEEARSKEILLAASKAPPFNVEAFLKLKDKAEAALERDKGLKQEEEMYQSEVQRLLPLVAQRKLQLLAKEEEMAAARLAAKEEAAAAAAPPPLPVVKPEEHKDPLDLDYRHRSAHPELQSQPRFMSLYTDMRARDRNLKKKQEERAEEASRLLHTLHSPDENVFGLEPTTAEEFNANLDLMLPPIRHPPSPTGASSGGYTPATEKSSPGKSSPGKGYSPNKLGGFSPPKAKEGRPVPINFRYREDLKVKLARSRLTVAELASRLSALTAPEDSPKKAAVLKLLETEEMRMILLEAELNAPAEETSRLAAMRAEVTHGLATTDALRL